MSEHAPEVASLGDRLDALTVQLGEAVKEYKAQFTGPDKDLAQRTKVNTVAREILLATQAPEEQWLDQSVSVCMNQRR
jgi:hypothetical protein